MKLLALAAMAFVVGGCAADERTLDEIETTASSTVPCDGIGARSTTDSGHAHDVCVPSRDLTFTSAPPEGVTYRTTIVDGHSHLVRLDKEQLETIERGDVVRVMTTSENEHMHAFTLAREGTLTPPPPPEPLL